jgi:dihydropteroate synthase
MKLISRRQTLCFQRTPLLMGIVNLDADSFSGDGLPNPVQAVEHAATLVEEGADIVDVGAESARTNRPPISETEEVDRFGGFLEQWRQSAAGSTPLSLNTWRPEVVRQVLPLGGDLLNDISGLPSPENALLCAQFGSGLVIMHTVGEPKVPHTHVQNEDVMAALGQFFSDKLAIAGAAGLGRSSIVLDPGLDFAKQCPDNLCILREFWRLHSFGRPILLPISRKTVIGEVLGIPEPAERDAGTIACLVQGLLHGAHIFRVHNVRAARQALRTIAALGVRTSVFDAASSEEESARRDR